MNLSHVMMEIQLVEMDAAQHDKQNLILYVLRCQHLIQTSDTEILSLFQRGG